MPEDCEKKAAELGFDLTKQFLTLAFAGIAFVVGLSFSTPGVVSTLMLWLVIGAFGGSAILGLIFLMHGVNLLSVQKSYDIYSSSLRGLAFFQIVLMLAGTVCIGAVLKRHSTKPTQATHVMEIKLDGQHSVEYPIETDRSTVVEIDGGKVKITSPKQ